jgi:hypothetical protein
MKLKSCSLTFFIVALFAGCSTDLEDPDMVPADEKLQLFTTRGTLTANGTDTTLVICRVPADAGRLDITFTTTKGIFLYSGINVVKEATDSVAGDYRYAATVLRADTVRNTVYITAETGINRKRISITFN